MNNVLVYPIIIHRTESGAVAGYFPDIDGLFFSGVDMCEALNDARLTFRRYARMCAIMRVCVPEPGNADALEARMKETGDEGEVNAVEVNL